MTAPARTLVDVVDALDGAAPGIGLTFTEGGVETPLPYPELRESARRIGRRFAGMGFERGDRVLMILPREIDFVQAYLGAVCAGVVPVPLYPPFLLAQLDSYLEGVRRVLDVTGAAAIVSSPELRELIGRTGSDVPFVPFEEIAAPGPENELPAVRPDDTAFLQFTSGSTAEPKGVVVPHRSLLANAQVIARHLQVDPEVDRAGSWLPLYHDMGLIGFVIVPLLTRASAWYMPPLDFARRPQAWPELMSRIRGTIAFAPNSGYGLVTKRTKDEDLDRWDLSAWRVAGCGAEPINRRVLDGFAERLAPAGFRAEALMPAYGMAEATLAIALTPLGRGVRSTPTDDGRELVSCGPVVPGHELRILGADGEELPEGEEGEIAFTGPSASAGYFRDPERTAAAFRDGWIRTGDLGLVNDGELYVTGRIKDLLIVRGRNHHPYDLEASVWDVPGVRTGNVVAFSCPGDDGEEQLVVVVESRPGADGDAIAGDVRSRIRARFGLSPGEVVVVPRDALPKTSSGKLQRRKTRAMYLDDALDRGEGALTAGES